jgi:hypothetical protein
VAPAKDVKALERNFVKVKVLCCPCHGIAATRSWLVDNCPAEVCTMIDDDQVFFKRIGDSIKLEAMSKDEVGKMIVEMEGLTMLYPMVGLSARQGNNHMEEPYLRTASRVHNHYALDLAVLRRENIRFDTMQLMEDFYVNLRLLFAGYETAKVVDRCWNQSESNASGGCSSYRNAEMQEQASKFLAKQFPSVVTVVEKKTKGGWFDGGIRYDVRIQWKKAMELGKQGASIL